MDHNVIYSSSTVNWLRLFVHLMAIREYLRFIFYRVSYIEVLDFDLKARTLNCGLNRVISRTSSYIAFSFLEMIEYMKNFSQ